MLWVLTDHRPGTASQVRGIAQHLDAAYHDKPLDYSPLAKLPNWGFFARGLHGIRNKHIIAPPWPDMVLSAGRRSAPVAAYIKRQHPNVRLVHSMHTGMQDSAAFDQVILPLHDNPSNADPRIFSTLGAPHALTDEMLQQAAQALPVQMPRPYTLLCVGGTTAYGKCVAGDVQGWMKAMHPCIQDTGTFLVTASRRTPTAITEQLCHALQASGKPVLDYVPGSTAQNPYHSWLAQADRVVVTADSVSMLSEAAYTAKPVYVLTMQHAASPKHTRFIDAMCDAGHARMAENYVHDWTGGERLDEAKRIADKLTFLYKKS